MMDIQREVEKLRDELRENSVWTNVVYVIDSNGNIIEIKIKITERRD